VRIEAEAPRPYDGDVDFSFAFTPDLIAVFLTLFVLEIVLGVDNVIFISILASKLPRSSRPAPATSASRWRCSSASSWCSSPAGSSR
jgi:hypothetical protein